MTIAMQMEPDRITLNGGTTSNFVTAMRQDFPADKETANLLPAAIGNVWWVDMEAGSFFTYNLRRVTTDRVFSVKFDLSNPIEPPGEPWGWSD
jgi:hypothetical protein